MESVFVFTMSMSINRASRESSLRYRWPVRQSLVILQNTLPASLALVIHMQGPEGMCTLTVNLPDYNSLRAAMMNPHTSLLAIGSRNNNRRILLRLTSPGTRMPADISRLQVPVLPESPHPLSLGPVGSSSHLTHTAHCLCRADVWRLIAHPSAACRLVSPESSP